MENVLEPLTSTTLLGRLRLQPLDQAAWADFVERYCPGIYRWCRSWGLQPADADEVTQEVLAKLPRKMSAFQYDPSRTFRGWLMTVTRHTWSDLCDSLRHRPGAVGSGDANALKLLETVEARDDLVRRLSDAFDLELLEAAMACARLQVSPRTWEAFRLNKREGMPAGQVARQLGMSDAQVFVYVGRVLQRVKIEVRRLEGLAAS